MANKILVARGTKARLEEIKSTLAANELVYSTDTGELGVKKANGNIEYFKNAADINAIMTGKQDKLVAGDSIMIDENNVIEVDLNAMSYFDYAGRIYGDKYSLLEDAWEHSLTVDPTEISADGLLGDNGRGKAQYPNGETEGIIIPQGVTTIGSGAFSNWGANNQPLVIPNSVTSIGTTSFYAWYKNNQPLIIPNSVTSIGMYTFAFWYANNQPLTIPNSVTSIGLGAFQSWYLVPYIEMKSTTPPSLASSDAFGEQNDAPIYVPDESVDDYKTATNWVSLADRIFPISDKVDLMDNIEGLKLDIQTIEQSVDGLENNKVDKVQGKGLSAQDYTFADMYKLYGIQDGAQVNEVNSVNGQTGVVELDAEDVGALPDDTPIPTKVSDLDNDEEFVKEGDLETTLLDYVEKEVGKGLSTNDYTDADKNKLDGIEAGAEKNTVNSVNTKQGVVVLNQDDIGDGVTYKRVTAAEKSAWDLKQDKLVAGDNITIDNNVINASGGPIVDLGTFNDETELITHVVMNQLPTGYYTFIMDGFPFFMLLCMRGTGYNGTLYDNFAKLFYFDVTINGNIVELKTIDLRDLELLVIGIEDLSMRKADKTYVDSKVQTDVPSGAKFTDTITTINGKTGTIAKADIVALGIPAQDTVYIHPTTHSISEVSGLQTALDGKVDDSQVLTNVPLNAKFTDTVYSHPSTHPASMITESSTKRFVSDVEKAYWDDKANATHTHTKSQITDFPTSMPPTAHSTDLLTSGTLGIARGGTGRTDGYAVGVVETRASVLTKIWTGTQAQYDAIGTKDANTLYFIM